ncbi:MAG: Spy/CpxP family protein refolding chaperone [Candidatus Margulisiibacteriota bacterium]
MPNLYLLTTTVLALVLLQLTPTFAEDPGHRFHKPDPEKKIEKLKTDLGLSDAQANQLKVIFKEQHKEDMAKRDAKTKEAHEAWIKEHEAMDAKIKAVLTPDQQAKFTTLKQQWRTERKEKMRNAMVKHLTQKLDLSKDQVPKVEAVFVQFQTDMDALMATKKPLSENKEHFKAIRDKRNEALKAILSPDQFKKFEHLRKKHGRGDRKPHWDNR